LPATDCSIRRFGHPQHHARIRHPVGVDVRTTPSIDQIHANHVIEPVWIEQVLLAIHALAVGGENRLQLARVSGGEERPLDPAAGTRDAVLRHHAGRVVFGIEAERDRRSRFEILRLPCSPRGCRRSRHRHRTRAGQRTAYR
jgi:hypothetical protein